jgi:hypothetical protein
MSDEDDKPNPNDVGYGRPPTDRQFRKGKSGNPKGRPRKDHRFLAPRQVRRDILSITEAPTTIQTAGGEIMVPTYVAVLMVARKKALSGHGPSIRLIMDRHNLAIAEHWDLEKMDKRIPDTLESYMRRVVREQDAEAIRKQVSRRKRRS